MESWLEYLADKHGVQRFRTRKEARDVKYLCEEGLVLARWLKHSPEVQYWQGRFARPGEKADAYVRKSANHPFIRIQIVTAFDGRSQAKEMRELNAKKVVGSFVGFLSQYDANQAALVTDRIRSKSKKQYPSDYWLLVSVEDSVHGLRKLPRVLAAAEKEAAASVFAKVYLVGMGKKQDVVRVK